MDLHIYRINPWLTDLSTSGFLACMGRAAAVRQILVLTLHGIPATKAVALLVELRYT